MDVFLNFIHVAILRSVNLLSCDSLIIFLLDVLELLFKHESTIQLEFSDESAVQIVRLENRLT